MYMVRGKLISLHTGYCIRGVFENYTILSEHMLILLALQLMPITAYDQSTVKEYTRCV